MPRIDPAVTSVVLLRPVDQSSGTPPQVPLRGQIVRLRQQYQFLSRHFMVMGEGMAAKAAASPRAIPIESAADRSAETLDRLAARLCADWVVSITIVSETLDPETQFDGAHFVAGAAIELQIRDARHHSWLANSTYTTRTRGSGVPPELLFAATGSVVDDALNTVLSPYPIVARVSEDGAIVDYLRGQQAPFICDPRREFTGLDAKQFARAHH